MQKIHTYIHAYIHVYLHTHEVCGPQFAQDGRTFLDMGWLRLVGSLKLYASFAQEPYKRGDILQKRP